MREHEGGVRLRRVRPEDVRRARGPVVDAETVAQAARIVEDVRVGGEEALRRHAERLGDLEPGVALVIGPGEMTAALEGVGPDVRGLLERTAGRIETFARRQLETAEPLDVAVEAGRAGHHLQPVETAGCYAPGGRFPLPSSALMTAVTARTAGVSDVWVASPRPTTVTLAAAAVAGADGLLRVGGAQAVAALAFGVGGVPACDVVVGPGNRWVTAAKQLLAGQVGIDMLAGPSELLIIASAGADPAVLAADLLAQAEHDTDAIPILVTTQGELVDQVEAELAAQLVDLPTADIAWEALDRNGFVVVVGSIDEAVACSEALAPEHLQLQGRVAEGAADRLSRYGSLFVGEATAEVFGDYGVGPNHTLPTGGTARHSSGLSVFDFLRRPTWTQLMMGADLAGLVADSAALARLEGLEAHARAAERRGSTG